MANFKYTGFLEKIFSTCCKCLKNQGVSNQVPRNLLTSAVYTYLLECN